MISTVCSTTKACCPKRSATKQPCVLCLGVPSECQTPFRKLLAALGAACALSDTTDIDLEYFVSVHPSASLVFTNTLHQMLVLQAIVHGCQLHNASPRYWLGPNYTMILEEWGRWRSQYGLEWIAAFGFSRVPPCIVSEMIQLCQEAGVLHVGDI